MKFFYHHIPKCAGRELITHLRNIKVDVIQHSFNPEAALKELDNIHDNVVVECEALYPPDYNWQNYITRFNRLFGKDTIVNLIKHAKFQLWETILFVRDPRDALLSLYYYYWERVGKDPTGEWERRHFGLHKYPDLNDFLLNVNVRFIPDWWSEFDFIAPSTTTGLSIFFKKYFNYDYTPSYVGKTKNTGFIDHCERELIRPEVQDKLNNTADYMIYRDIYESSIYR